MEDGSDHCMDSSEPGGYRMVFQGIDVIPGSFMTGQGIWVVAGVLSAIAGIGAFRSSLRKPTVEGASTPEEIANDSDEARAN